MYQHGPFRLPAARRRGRWGYLGSGLFGGDDGGTAPGSEVVPELRLVTWRL